MAGQERMSVAGLYISSSCANAKATAIAINDLTTGEVITYETVQADEILHLLQIYCVKEIIVATSSTVEEIRAKYGIRCGLHVAPYTPLRGIPAEEYFHVSCEDTHAPSQRPWTARIAVHRCSIVCIIEVRGRPFPFTI
jgi:hypothetical protein